MIGKSKLESKLVWYICRKIQSQICRKSNEVLSKEWQKSHVTIFGQKWAFCALQAEYQKKFFIFMGKRLFH